MDGYEWIWNQGLAVGIIIAIAVGVYKAWCFIAPLLKSLIEAHIEFLKTIEEAVKLNTETLKAIRNRLDGIETLLEKLSDE